MKTVTTIKEWQTIRKQLQGSVGFVPTMGHLHDGHFALCAKSQEDNDVTVVSIFINPNQFDRNDDFNLYPRTFLTDQENLAQRKIDYLFYPETNAIYADHYQVQIHETELSKELEGQYRPHHFNGVLTVVLKFINIVEPTRAYFGEKDFQQLLLIQKMVDALFLPIKIVACKTVRETDGLAYSSRNSRLNPIQRRKAALFPQVLKSTENVMTVWKRLETLGFKVDYVIDKWQRRLAAVWIDDVRLLDNIMLHDNPIENKNLSNK